MANQDFERRVRERAYRIWEEEGRPAGCEAEHWDRARSQVAAEMASAGAAPPPEQRADPRPGHAAEPKRTMPGKAAGLKRPATAGAGGSVAAGVPGAGKGKRSIMKGKDPDTKDPKT